MGKTEINKMEEINYKLKGKDAQGYRICNLAEHGSACSFWRINEMSIR